MKNIRAMLYLLIAAALLFPMVGKSEVREFQSLDGQWEIVFDKQNEGRAGEWQKQKVFQALETRRKIAVPSCWEEIEKDYEGVGFYGKKFKVSNDWKGKVVRLQFGAVNYVSDVYVNDTPVGRHEGGYANFEFRIDDLLEFGKENFLSLRVIGPIVATDQVIDGIGQSDMPHWRGAIAGGIWQSVRLVATGTAFVDDAFIVPHLKDDTAKVQLVLENTERTAREVDVDISILSKGKVVVSKSEKLKLVPGTNEADWTLKIRKARYWSPDDPHLYTARISIDGQDEKAVRFGMRELTIRNKKFELNGKPIYIKAAFFEGLYPTRLAMPDSPEMARREIQLAKEAGFNMIRPWRKPPPPMWLDMCDEMGVMVVGGFAIECMTRWPTATPQLRDRVENEVGSAILRDRNRACIVQWEIFNELHRKELIRLMHPVSMLARKLDPSRLILDESGGFAGGSNMYLPYKFEPELFNDVHSYPGAPLGDLKYDRFLALAKTPEEIKELGLPSSNLRSGSTPGLLTVVSEIGYGSLPDLVDNNERFKKDGNPLVPPYRYHMQMAEWISGTLKESGLDAVYPDLQKFCLDQQQIHSQGNKRMIEAIRSNSNTGGYAVHALTGGDWVLGAGLLDLWRNPKGSYWGTKEANAPRYLALRIQPRNVYASKGAKITLTGINDLDAVGGTLSFEIVAADGTKVLETKTKVRMPVGISSLLKDQLDAAKLSGVYKANVQLAGKDGNVLAKNAVWFNVFNAQQLAKPSAKFAILDTGNKLRSFLKSQGVDFVEFNPKTPRSVPVFVGKAEAKNPKDKAKFQALEKFVKQGGTAVYLETIIRKNPASYWAKQLPKKEVLPLRPKMENSFGLWVGVSHVVTDHPVFAGLPSKRMMGQAYENVYAPHTLMITDGEVIVGSVSHGWYQGDKDKQHHIGPSPAWYGMDLGVVQHGQGRYVLSSMRLLENLGNDPVADKILYNLIDWTTGN